MFGAVQHQRRVDGLAALRGAAAARQHWNAFVRRDLDGDPQVLLGPGHHHADRLHLIDRGIGGVAATGEGIEAHLALDLARQSGGEARVSDP